MEKNNEEILEYEEKELQNDDNEDTQLFRYQINSYSVDRSIETLIKWKKNGKLIVPDFQRDYVWPYSNAVKFIDSILLSLPIPNIFVFKITKDNAEKYLLVDGMQRITTMEQFTDGVWKQSNKEKEFIIDFKASNWFDKKYSTLSEEDRQFFLDYPISVMIFETNIEGKADYNESIYSVFERINTGSEKLTDQEIRNAVYQGDCLNRIKAASHNKYFSMLIDNDSKIKKRDKDIELLTRILTYRRIYRNSVNGKDELIVGKKDSKIKNSKRAMLNKYMSYSNSNLIDYNKDIEELLKACEVICTKDKSLFYNIIRNAKTVGKRVHEVFAEALVIAVIENNFIIDANSDSILANKIELWKNRDLFYNMLSSNTTDINSIKKRVDFVYKMIKG